jgi:hypothetical protein
VSRLTPRGFVNIATPGRLSRMSDQNPPSSPSPEEPVADSTAPPPPPPPTADETGATALPPEEKKSGRGRLIGIIAAVVVLVLIAGGLVAFFALRSTDHKLTTPATAGSMKRDTAREKTLATQLNQAKEQFKTQGQAKGKGKGSSISYVKSAVYNQASSKRGPSGALVFLGAKLTKDQSPAKWVADKFTKQAKTNGLKITKIDPGDSDTRAVCASVASPQKVAICAWATHDTIGELVPTVPGYDAKTLAKIMIDLRKDVEQSE